MAGATSVLLSRRFISFLKSLSKHIYVMTMTHTHLWDGNLLPCKLLLRPTSAAALHCSFREDATQQELQSFSASLIIFGGQGVPPKINYYFRRSDIVAENSPIFGGL